MSLPHPRRLILLSLLICAAGAAGAQNRPTISASFVKVQGAGSTVSGYLAKPSAGSGLPAVLLVPVISTLKGEVLETARDLAAHGFVALVVDYDAEHVSQESDLVQSIADEQLSLRLTAAAEWLAGQRPLVDPRRVSAISWGGGWARVLKLVQQGQVHAAVMMGDDACGIPQNPPAVSLARTMTVIAGCAPAGESAAVWSDVYKSLGDAAAGTAPSAPAASPMSVVTIRDIMRVINSDDGVKGRLARLLAPSSGADVQWDLARSHAAILVESCDWLIGLPPPKGSIAGWRGHVADYRAATETLLKAVQQHNLAAAQQALGRLPQSCGSCHADHR
ncbi:MAG: hypothetical protein ABI833_08460 [Acidobacteriota bacterium]